MAYDEDLASRVRPVVPADAEVTERKMSGCLAFLLEGHMFAGIVGSDLMVRPGYGARPPGPGWRHGSGSTGCARTRPRSRVITPTRRSLPRTRIPCGRACHAWQGIGPRAPLQRMSRGTRQALSAS
jgi:hypothetical protein